MAYAKTEPDNKKKEFEHLHLVMYGLVHFWWPMPKLNQIIRKKNFEHLHLGMYGLVHVWWPTPKLNQIIRRKNFEHLHLGMYGLIHFWRPTKLLAKFFIIHVRFMVTNPAKIRLIHHFCPFPLRKNVNGLKSARIMESTEMMEE